MMIELFEEYTEPLNEEEMDMVPWIVKGLGYHIGSDQAIPGTEIRSAIQKKKGVRISGARLRKILHYIRTEEGYPIILANSKGYYQAKNQKEIEVYLRSLKTRIEAITHLHRSITRNEKLQRIQEAQKLDPFKNL